MFTKSIRSSLAIRKTGTLIVALYLALGLPVGARATESKSVPRGPLQTLRARTRARLYKALHARQQIRLPADLLAVQQAIDAIVRGAPDARKDFDQAAANRKPFGPHSPGQARHLQKYVGVLTRSVVKAYAKAPTNEGLARIADDLSHAAMALEDVELPSSLWRSRHTINELHAMITPRHATDLFYQLTHAFAMVSRRESPSSDASQRVLTVAKRVLRLSTFTQREVDKRANTVQAQVNDLAVSEQAAKTVVAARKLSRASERRREEAQQQLGAEILNLNGLVQQPLRFSKFAILRMGSAIQAAIELPGEHHTAYTKGALEYLREKLAPIYMPLRMVAAAGDLGSPNGGDGQAAQMDLARGILGAHREMTARPHSLSKKALVKIYTSVEEVHDLAGNRLSEMVVAGLDAVQSQALSMLKQRRQSATAPPLPR